MEGGRSEGPALLRTGGEGGIRTHGTRKGSTVFETARFNHSRTSPNLHSTGFPNHFQELSPSLLESSKQALSPIWLHALQSIRPRVSWHRGSCERSAAPPKPRNDQAALSPVTRSAPFGTISNEPRGDGMPVSA